MTPTDEAYAIVSLEQKWVELKTQLHHELEQREISFDILEDLGQDTGMTFGCIHMIEHILKIMNDMEGVK